MILYFIQYAQEEEGWSKPEGFWLKLETGSPNLQVIPPCKDLQIISWGCCIHKHPGHGCIHSEVFSFLKKQGWMGS